MVLGLVVLTAACAASKSRVGFTGSGGAGAGGTSNTGGTGNGGSITWNPQDGGTGQAFDVKPTAIQTITVTAGQMTPTVPYTASANGMPVNVGWAVQQGNIGSMPAGPSSAAVFTPTGKTGGVATVQAGLSG
jgi:hypothetical protein